MTDQNAGATLVKASQARTGHTAAMAPTHPMSGSTSGDSAALSVLETARVELKSGNVEAAIRRPGGQRRVRAAWQSSGCWPGASGRLDCPVRPDRER